jgi:predicted metal-binding membrane protein
MVAGAASLFLLFILRYTHATEHRWVIGVGFLAAAAWQSTALKRRLAAACHRTRPLAPDGWAAHRDCLYFGADHGIHCVGNCGVLMFASMLSPWHQAIMVVVTLLLLYERYRPRPIDCVIPLTLGVLAIGHYLY